MCTRRSDPAREGQMPRAGKSPGSQDSWRTCSAVPPAGAVSTPGCRPPGAGSRSWRSTSRSAVDPAAPQALIRRHGEETDTLGVWRRLPAPCAVGRSRPAPRTVRTATSGSQVLRRRRPGARRHRGNRRSSGARRPSPRVRRRGRDRPRRPCRPASARPALIPSRAATSGASGASGRSTATRDENGPVG